MRPEFKHLTLGQLQIRARDAGVIGFYDMKRGELEDATLRAETANELGRRARAYARQFLAEQVRDAE